MPGPPSQLHRPALLFSCVAGLITYPHDCTRTHGHARTHLFLRVFLSILLSHSCSPFSPPFFLSLCHILCSYSAPTNFFLSACFFLLFFCHSVTLFSYTWDIVHFFFCFFVTLSSFLMLLSFCDILLSPLFLTSLSLLVAFYSQILLSSHLLHLSPSPTPSSFSV